VDKWCDNLEEIYFESSGPSSPRSPYAVVPRPSPLQTSRNNSMNTLPVCGGDSVCTEDSEETQGTGVGSSIQGPGGAANGYGEFFYRERKLMKQRLRQVVQDFNDRPLKEEWVRSAVKAGILNQTVVEFPSLASATASTSTTPSNSTAATIGNVSLIRLTR